MIASCENLLISLRFKQFDKSVLMTWNIVPAFKETHKLYSWLTFEKNDPVEKEVSAPTFTKKSHLFNVFKPYNILIYENLNGFQRVIFSPGSRKPPNPLSYLFLPLFSFLLATVPLDSFAMSNPLCSLPTHTSQNFLFNREIFL